ncbi:PRC-barrel domain-containing protein [Methanosarcina sp. Kolksee]|jgi:sporulation protein YlmC with PRC-barrel domain|uniref:PRC-barrel domain-containing protein n=1 Tax=Methanosarcina sp. Kolksee TaxID=1434099 RepID=UPI00064E5E3B|nr:PRC-barrel domain-containing protein [Methanosarcina sp. Kolksee]
MSATMQAVREHFMLASDVKGHKVVNKNAEDLGKIEDYMLDLENGRIAYAVLSFGGFLGMGEKLFAIPWSAFNVQLFENDMRIVLNVDKEILTKAQGFDKSQLPLSYSQLSSVYTYYGYKPYWQTGDLT